MSSQNTKSAFVATGLMLFALFFGAGNLIFPASMGQQAGNNVFSAMLGFLFTGVGLPLLGVLAIGYSGTKDVQELASRVTKWYGVAFAVALYLAIGPLFATPRTATVSFEIGVLPFLGDNLATATKDIALRVFLVFFFGVAYWLSVTPSKLVDRVGKILTPVLLVSIAVLVITAAVSPMGAPQAPAEAYQSGALAKGMIEGYGTMDALASLVFAIIVIDAVRAMGVNDKGQILKLTTSSGFVAAGCLAAVYVFIGYMGATSVAGIGAQDSGAAVLSLSAGHYFGNGGKVLLALIVFLACLSTAVGLITSCGEYFNRLIPNKLSYRNWVIVFTLVSFGFANFGLNAIIKFSVPVLMLLYPLTIAIIALAFLDKFFGGRRIVYICTIIGTLPIAILDGWKTANAMLDGSKEALVMHIDVALKEVLPFYSSGLGWILPAIAGFVIGVVLSKAVKKQAQTA
ncbi:branched-chain amino acid transport system II carrier protein [Kingella negevensis]|uniref:branched-chain amino acid transport system II carrier protein n=1 Tax=Kingella negevensis TaxID=1522312 RepID=UPI0025437AA5|nr:branched-chain amino acid transport system II carrier protein [Kingella negevensis]WII92669.1 branched-chain amino acid transport system II carrier protein [Kingella negevensis]